MGTMKKLRALIELAVFTALIAFADLAFGGSKLTWDDDLNPAGTTYRIYALNPDGSRKGVLAEVPGKEWVIRLEPGSHVLAVAAVVQVESSLSSPVTAIIPFAVVRLRIEPTEPIVILPSQ